MQNFYAPYCVKVSYCTQGAAFIYRQYFYDQAQCETYVKSLPMKIVGPTGAILEMAYAATTSDEEEYIEHNTFTTMLEALATTAREKHPFQVSYT